ncbi:peptidoglycan editing factor PgeF [Vibrio zhugei]|uniref:Purine nucleoside phosphorylase n=1 Tax=Vibrio zhugei TaxID=2479546 RepID=A0ABV7C523_9VIBR|nr:peptidoglycan editing factor PgeF [Vibrio zhugei]
MHHIIPNWPAPKSIKAFSSTRVGGVSQGQYQGLNLGAHVGDNVTDVENNRASIAQTFAMPAPPIWLNQTHSTRVLRAESPQLDTLDADGICTALPHVVCTVMTADCLPVLITNTSGTQVAAVHAGWRGLAGGIIENALAQIHGEALVWLGPAIGPDKFEVGDDVVEAFTHVHEQTQQAFLPQENGKWLADMEAITRIRLHALGVDGVYSCKLCTYQHPKQFYSYRRDGVTGRQASFIWIQP